MKRLIGIHKPGKNPPAPPPPTISDCISNVDKRADEVEKKVNKCQVEFKKLNEQMKVSRTGPAKQLLRQKATRVLQQMRGYETQAETLRQQSFNMDQASSTIQTAKDTQVIISTMKMTISETKKAYKKLDVDEIDDLQEKMSDLLELSNEVQAALSQSYSLPNVDEDELQAEFDILGDDIALDEDTSFLDEAVKPPVQDPSPGPNDTLTNVNGIPVDEFGLPIITANAEQVRKN